MGVDNATVARRYVTEIWGKGNLEVIDELVGDGIVLKDPMTSTSVTGKQQLEDRLKETSKSFSNTQIVIEDVIVAGDRVIVLATWRGEHSGDFFNVKKTGKTVTCKSAEVLRIEAGKVVENISYFDNYTMFEQLGVLPPPDQLKPKEAEAAAPTARA